mmetsp:Transcript_16801/g.43432  ORF Transcript_16801/g.43432 Transcript_16801/m.43432 type:complete len:333 (+) Transcript_16801:91-1089(+)
MNTAKGVARVTLQSPKALSFLAISSSLTISALVIVIRSQILYDDMVILAIVVLLALIVYYQLDWMLGPVEWLAPEVVWRIPVRSPRAALTIDDVPLLARPTAFEDLLDVLKKHEVKATLFVMSGFDLPTAQGGMESKARERCRELLKRAVEEGHELANHMQFDKPAIAMSNQEFDEAFLHCDTLLAELVGGKDAWLGRQCRWFRPASAMWNQHMLKVAEEHGYTTVISNCYPHDVAAVTRHFNAGYLQRRVRPGAVIVVHDRWHTPATLDKALPLIAEKGIELVTLSRLQEVADAENEAFAKLMREFQIPGMRAFPGVQVPPKRGTTKSRGQ